MVISYRYSLSFNVLTKENQTMNPRESNESDEMWPTLNEAHGGVADVPPSPPEDNGWEIVRQNDDEDEAIEIEVLPTSMRKLRHCASSPDLRSIGRTLEAVDEDVTIDSSDSSAVLVSTKTTSFRDAILSPSKTTSDETKQQDPAENAAPQTRPNKIKPKIVVTPIRRCSKSTGDLRTLVIDENEVLGESDAMDYYHRKEMGASGRINSLKVRPDEAKRRSITMYKKQMQRQQQQAAV